MCIKKGQNPRAELERLQWKDKKKIPMFKRIWSENQCVYMKGYNSSVWKDKNRTTIPVCGRIGAEFQCLKGLDQNSNV